MQTFFFIWSLEQLLHTILSSSKPGNRSLSSLFCGSTTLLEVNVELCKRSAIKSGWALSQN
jgi:hypothetical protein